MLYEYDLLDNCLSDGFSLKERIRPLIFTQVKGINGFEDMVIFGGYLGNRDKKPVHIYKRVDKDKWDVVYTFKQGEINHIHNIIPDSYRNCLWVLTGDFDSSSAIWKITDNFKNVERVFIITRNIELVSHLCYRKGYYMPRIPLLMRILFI